MGLGIALLSYDGKLRWGFNADYDLVPDLPEFVEAVRQSFEEIQGVTREMPLSIERPARQLRRRGGG